MYFTHIAWRRVVSCKSEFGKREREGSSREGSTQNGGKAREPSTENENCRTQKTFLHVECLNARKQKERKKNTK